MKTSDNGIKLIKRHEGLRLEAYLCPAGVWTIGYGHIKGVKKGDKITEQQAEVFLRDDLAWAENAVNKQKLDVNQNQFDALVSFTFNVGSENFQQSTLLKKVKANANDATIANEFRKWRYAKGKVLNGLIGRREDELKLYFS